MVGVTPPDFDTRIMMEIFETCTVLVFLLFITTLQTNASLNKYPLLVDDVLEKVEEQYRILIIRKKWDTIGPTGSSFCQRGGLQRNEHNPGRCTCGSSGGARITIFPNWAVFP